MKQKAIDSIAAVFGLIFILPQLALGCNTSIYSDFGRCNGVSCRSTIFGDDDATTCESGFCAFGICETSPLPTWAILLIAGVSFVIVVSIGLVYRHCRIKRLKKAEAQFLARNQMVAAGAAPMIVNHVPHQYMPLQPHYEQNGIPNVNFPSRVQAPNNGNQINI